MLLGVGFLSTVNVVITALDLDRFLQLAFELYGGTGEFSPANDLSVPGAVLASSHIVLFAATVLITRAFVRSGRLSFWVPLVAGVVANLVLFVTLSIVLTSDPAVYGAMIALMSPQGSGG